jgi:hypothetical protein
MIMVENILATRSAARKARCTIVMAAAEVRLDPLLDADHRPRSSRFAHRRHRRHLSAMAHAYAFAIGGAICSPHADAGARARGLTSTGDEGTTG